MLKIKKKINFQLIFILFILSMNVMKVISIGTLSFNASIADIFLPLIVLILLIKCKKIGINQTFFMWQWGLTLIIWLFISSMHAVFLDEIANVNLYGTFAEIFKTIIVIIYFIIGYNCFRYLDHYNFKKVWLFGIFEFVILGVILNIISKLPHLSHLVDSRYKLYFMGSYTDPNHAATLLGINSIILFNWAIEEKNRYKILYLLTGISTSVLILLSNSRGGIIACIVALFIFLLLHFKKIWNYFFELFLMIYSVFLFIFGIDHIFNNNEFISKMYLSFGNFSDGMNVRLGLSKVALLMSFDHPIFGVGRGNFILNSKQYFDDIGVSFINKIPHNTYLGLWAETGILGVVLYMFPLFLLLYYLIRKQSCNCNGIKISMWMPVLFIIAIQGSLLNIENQRTLWFLLGSAMWIFLNKKNDHTSENKIEYEKIIRYPFEISPKIMRTSMIIVALLLTIVFKNILYINLTYEPVKDNIEYNIPVDLIELGKPIEVSYSLQVEPQNIKADLLSSNVIRVEIFENIKGKLYLISENVYPQVIGMDKVIFSKSQSDSQIIIRFTNMNNKLQEFNVKLNYVKSDETFRRLDKVYILRSNFLSKITMGFLSYDSDEKSIYETISKETFIMSDTFKVKVLNLDVDSDVYLLSIELEVLKDIPYRSTFWCYGIPESVSVLNASEMKSGVRYFNSFSKSEYIDLSVGQKLTIEYTIPRDASYDVNFGGYITTENGNEHLLFNDTQMRIKKIVNTLKKPQIN